MTKKSEWPIGSYAIVRSKSAGVFAGVIKSFDGSSACILGARRLWYWSGAATLSQLAEEGVTKPYDCKFPQPVECILVGEVVEVLKTSVLARKSIESVAIWKA